MRHDIEVGHGEDRRPIAVLARPGRAPPVVWFGGFRSDMVGAKADALDAWAAEAGQAFVRFDYSGHGASGGRFEDGTISRWLEEAMAVLDAFVPEPPVLVGSSMGGWLALLANRAMRAARPRSAPTSLVLVAPAVDFTERLMWDAFTPDIRETLLRDGVYLRPSPYAPEGYPITHRLIEDGRGHLLLDAPLETGCPVHVLQGWRDPDVPWQHAVRLVEHLPGDGVQLTSIRDGDHRLSRPEDLDRLVGAVEAACRVAGEGRQLRLTV